LSAFACTQCRVPSSFMPPCNSRPPERFHVRGFAPAVVNHCKCRSNNSPAHARLGLYFGGCCATVPAVVQASRVFVPPSATGDGLGCQFCGLFCLWGPGALFHEALIFFGRHFVFGPLRILFWAPRIVTGPPRSPQIGGPTLQPTHIARFESQRECLTSCPAAIFV
jgi:hypothetical protein